MGEGGNLGFTRRARVEYSAQGGRINADFIDNSAGVDCSDHEVNLKILLGLAEQRGEMTRPQRDELLEAMDKVRERRDYVCFALMITDIMTQGTSLLVSGKVPRVERALGERDGDGVIDLPGVMSRKKQLAPKLLELF